MTKIINLFGAPCSGKSVTAMGLTSELRRCGWECEYVSEYAKDKIWEDNISALKHQIYIFGQQYYRINILLDKVDYIVTDSPLLLSSYYGKDLPWCFHELVRYAHNLIPSINVFLTRSGPYSLNGRVHSEEEAISISNTLYETLENELGHIPIVPGDAWAVSWIINNMGKTNISQQSLV